MGLGIRVLRWAGGLTGKSGGAASLPRTLEPK
jgi:hypothetical protein